MFDKYFTVPRGKQALCEIKNCFIRICIIIVIIIIILTIIIYQTIRIGINLD